MNAAKRKKIKLCIIIDFIYAILGGTEIQLYNLIQGLDQTKYDIYLICLRNTPWLKKNFHKLKCHVKAFSYNWESHKDPRNIQVVFNLWRFLKSVKPDIVICFFKISYMLGVLTAHFAGVPKILSTRRDFGLWIDSRSIHLLKFANRYVDKIVTNSNLVKELVCDKEGFKSSQIRVIYNGLSIINSTVVPADKNFKGDLGIPVGNTVVGIVAGLRPMKRHMIFLETAKRVLSHRNDVDFVLVGDGPLRVELEQFSIKLGIHKRVHFTGFIDDVRPFLLNFDIGINCSANEGMSNAIMEYMFFNVPCIVSKAGGNAELINNGVNGYTFELDNDKELAKLTLYLLENPELGTQFANKAKGFILRECSTKKMIQGYDDLFSRLYYDD